jgi:ABC-type cobalt transport system substrate-binding protein
MLAKQAKENLMKKIIVLAAVAILLASAMVLVSCDGGGCPGGGSADAGECVVTIKSGDSRPDFQYCKNEDCGIFKYISGGDQMKDIMAGNEVNKKCDC